MTEQQNEEATGPLRAPFPYFGGKSKVAHEVWHRFGDVQNFVEPFCGSAAVLLARPTRPRIETVNDMNCFISNFWRAVTADPQAVAQLCDWPINEADLHARHRWLMLSGASQKWRELMKRDPDHYNVKIAAWWVWGSCQWIGAGWCNGTRIIGEGATQNGKLPNLSGTYGQRGVHKSGVLVWFEQLSRRLRRVRVACGDWKRVCTPAVTTGIGVTGVFLDPPYSAEANRDNDIYAVESKTVAHEVRAWCLENGNNPKLRIALCGYEGEHDELEAAGWRVHAWRTGGGYANQNKGGQGMLNAKRERIWFSPHCLTGQEDLFGNGNIQPAVDVPMATNLETQHAADLERLGEIEQKNAMFFDETEEGAQ